MDLINAFLGKKSDDEEIPEPGTEENPIVSKSGKDRRRMHRKARRMGQAFARRSQKDYIRELKARQPGALYVPGPVEGKSKRSEPLGRTRFGVRADRRQARHESEAGADLVKQT